MVAAPSEGSEDNSNIGTDRAVVRGLRLTSLTCSYTLASLGVAVLIGWWLGSPMLTSIQPALASMKPNTALGFVLGGVSLRLAHETSREAERWMRLLATIGALLGAVTLSEYAFAWDAGIDQLIFADPLSTVAAPGRMSPVTATLFVLLAAALLLDRRSSPASWRPSEWLALAAGAASIIALLGYLYGVRSLYAVGPFASIALHTALAFLLYASGILAAHPELGLMRLVASDGPGGLLARRLLPAALSVPVLLGWLRLLGQRAGWYGTEFGLALFAASNVLCFAALVWATARTLHMSEAVRRRAEAQVRASEESLAITLQSIGDAVIATDDRGCVARMNPVAVQLTGYSLERAEGRPLRDVFRIVHQGTRAVVENPADRVLREGLVVGLANHTVLIAADGSERPIADSGAPIRDALGNVRGVVLVFRDVGEEERRAREREKSDQLLRAAYAAGRMVAWEADLETRALQVSDNAREILGLDAGRLGRLDDALALLHSDDRESVASAFRLAARGGTVGALRFRALRPDTQKILWLEWRSVTLGAPQREPTLRGVVIDVSESVCSEDALRISEARYRTQFEAAPEAIVTLDVDSGAFIEANENAERLFGHQRQALYRLNPAAISPAIQPDGRSSLEASREYVERALAGDRPVFEWVHRNAAGVEIPCEVRLVRLPGGRNLCRGSVLDISARKAAEAARRELEETLRNTEDQLRQSQKMEAVGRLAAGVAHDFNNLLSVISGYGELLLGGLGPADPMRDGLEHMASASRRAAKLTAQLLAFGRQQVLSARIVDLNQIIRELGDMLHRVIGEDIELSLTLRAGSNVCVDPSQIEQVVMNLVVNARDAMPSGGHLSIETADAELDPNYANGHLDVEPGRYVMLAVSDTGCGMEKATIERIFEPFFTTKGLGKGTGLGLSTVFGIVKQSGGNIWVYSERGQGTTFKLYLPRTEQPLQPATVPVSAAKTLHGSETVLLVEDDEQVRGLARTILCRHGYLVLEAGSGGEALLICEQFQQKVDVLLTDVVMPRMSGRELAQRLVLLRPEMKVLFMSGYTDDAIVHHGVLRSEMAFVQKPLLPEPLLVRLRQVLDAEPRAEVSTAP